MNACLEKLEKLDTKQTKQKKTKKINNYPSERSEWPKKIPREMKIFYDFLSEIVANQNFLGGRAPPSGPAQPPAGHLPGKWGGPAREAGQGPAQGPAGRTQRPVLDDRQLARKLPEDAGAELRAAGPQDTPSPPGRDDEAR